MPEGEDVKGKLETLKLLRSESRDPRVLPLSGLWVGAPALQSLRHGYKDTLQAQLEREQLELKEFALGLHPCKFILHNKRL